MDDRTIKDFKKNILYKDIGFIILILSPIPICISQNIIAYTSTIIILLLGIYFERRYRCPVCGYVFDPRINACNIKYCVKCRAKLRNEEDFD